MNEKLQNIVRVVANQWGTFLDAATGCVIGWNVGMRIHVLFVVVCWVLGNKKKRLQSTKIMQAYLLWNAPIPVMVSFPFNKSYSFIFLCFEKQCDKSSYSRSKVLHVAARAAVMLM